MMQSKSRVKDITGQIFGDLIVTGLKETKESPSGNRISLWTARCSKCNKIFTYALQTLQKSPNAKECGRHG